MATIARRSTYPLDLTDDQWVLIDLLLLAAPARGPPAPRQTVYWYFSRWEQAKVTEQIMTLLRRRVHTTQGRRGAPSTRIIDSQSVKGGRHRRAGQPGL